MDLAKQGDPHAIAALINRSLASKGIHADAELESDCLTISLKAAQIPNQKAVVTIIHRGMIVLQVQQIKRVKIFTYRSDNHYLAWQYEIDLGMDFTIDVGSESKESLPIVRKTTDDQQNDHQKVIQDQNMNLVNNPKGVILVQKLSQIQRNLQEYQDIIVRFTDEQVGTVRCLTTLTELIQVISQPSFLFAAVAANPNLRSLLDTIAESSKTDEHGDQVITNLSILQPGQQWQKAKIRLVSKIFLEPIETVQDQDISEVSHQGITLDLEEENQHLESEIITPQIPDHDSSIISSEMIADSFTEDLGGNFAPDSILDSFAKDLASNLAPDPMPENITINSLFDDFPEPTSPTSTSFHSEKIVNDITEISETSDSLFDDFINVDMNVDSPSNNFGDDSFKNLNNIYQSANIPSDSTSEKPAKQNNTDDNDLFGSFSSTVTQAENPIKVDVPEINTNIDSIKSRIPKQNLDKLLQLLDEEDQTKADLNQNVSNLETVTLESILSNMETITLSGGLGSKSSDDFVTLDDFSKELDSVGF
jgi:hypothetical protein